MRAALLVLMIVFCAGPALARDFKAALILEHEGDSPWHRLLKQGLERAGKDFGLQTEVVAAPPGPEQRDVFRKAAEKSDLVIVASDNFHEALRDNAANYRRVMFGSVDAGIRAANIMSVTFADEQAAFLAGAAAAMLTTQTDTPGINSQPVIAWLSGQDTPAMRSLFSGFSEGAALANPGVRVIQAIAGSFTDRDTAAAKAAWLLDSGADVIALAAGAANAGALAEVEKRGAWHISLDSPDNSRRELGAIAKAADQAVYEIVESAQSGKFRAKEIVVYDMANKGVDFVGLAEFIKKAGKSVPALERRAGELRHELLSGSIKLHSLRQRTLCDCLD